MPLVVVGRAIHFSFELLHTGPHQDMRVFGINGDKGLAGQKLEGLKKAGARNLQNEKTTLSGFKFNSKPLSGDQSNMSEIVLFQDKSGKLNLHVKLDNETVWLTQQQMADLFDTTQQYIAFHLKNIFSYGELDPKATHKDFLLVRNEGGRSINRNVAHYNLDAIISVGYRVNSKLAVTFRQWATHILRDHLVKGFTINPERIAALGFRGAQEALATLARALDQQPELSSESRQILE